MNVRTLPVPLAGSRPFEGTSAVDPDAEAVVLSLPVPRPAADRSAIEALAQRALSGRPEATAELISALRPKIEAYCRARLGRDTAQFDLADDVAQDVCLAVVTALPRFRDMGRPFLAYVYGIAANKVADAKRRESRAPLPLAKLPDETDDTCDPEETAVRILEARQARELLDKLPPQQREILLLRVIGGMSAGEAGEVLGLTSNNVRVQQYRALTRLRAMMSPDGEGH